MTTDIPIIFAYVGPGLGLGAIGIMLATFFAFFTFVLGLVFYPLKKLIGKIRNKKKNHQDTLP